VASAGRLCSIFYVKDTECAAPLELSVVSAHEAADAGTGIDQIEYCASECKSIYRSVIMLWIVLKELMSAVAGLVHDSAKLQ
jgi:hypothetical protein